MSKAIVLHSGGMDSSLCLHLATKRFDEVISLGFFYNQRHLEEMSAARRLCGIWGIERVELDASLLATLNQNALTSKTQPIQNIEPNSSIAPPTMVMGRNGLFCFLAGLWGHQKGISTLVTGVMELEVANSGYRDCSRDYMNRVQDLLRIDLADDDYEIWTPLVRMDKLETIELAHKQGVLTLLLEETITCYEGVPYWGCKHCAACLLRNRALKEFCQKNPAFILPKAYRVLDQ